MDPLFESCIDGHDAALASAGGGAGRVELCARLDVGGTTPDRALIERCVASLAIPVFVMIRRRGGDFVYGADEVEAMVADIGTVIAAGAHGVVFGALRPDATIDTGTMRRLIDRARPLPVTCHKAIDAARDPIEALDALLALGVDRVLTSGGADTATAGAATIARMVARAGDGLVVMAGGVVRAGNVAALVRQTGVREVHARILPVGEATPADAHTLSAWAREISAVVDAARRTAGD
ncbi:MAG: copper homeostasis protein CutC [Vicinamibacteraceae bacterium]